MTHLLIIDIDRVAILAFAAAEVGLARPMGAADKKLLRLLVVYVNGRMACAGVLANLSMSGNQGPAHNS